MIQQCLSRLNGIKQHSKGSGDVATQLRAYDLHWIIKTGRLSIGQQWPILHMDTSELEQMIQAINESGVPDHAEATRDWVEQNIQTDTALLDQQFVYHEMTSGSEPSRPVP